MTEKTFISWEEIQTLSDILADKIKATSSDLGRVTLVAVSRGGLVPAQIIAYKLNIRDIRVMKLISYNSDNVRGETKDISTDRLFDGADVYFIDDLADSGETIRYIRSRFPASHLCTLMMKTCCMEMPEFCAKSNVAAESWLVFPWD